jgi:LysR family transcriptional regulator, hydrogen peroxide-inducible genes activator
MVAAGFGVTLLPELAAEGPFAGTRGLAIRRFSRPEPHRRVGAVWRRSTTRGAAIAAICEVITATMDGAT